MSHIIIVHVMNEDPIIGEVDELPTKTDQWLTITNPHRRDGKDVPYLEPDALSVIIPIHRITFIEAIPSDMEEQIISHYKD